MNLFRYLIIKCISPIYCSCTNVKKDHPRSCTDARTCLRFLKKTHNNSVRGIFLKNAKIILAPCCMCLHTFSLHNKPAVYKPAVKLLSLKWKPHRDESLSTVYRPNWYLVTRSGFANTFSTSAGSKTPAKTSSPMKIKKTATSSTLRHTLIQWVISRE